MSDRRLRNRNRGATFLCYHSVAAAGPRYLTVTPRLFERQLEEIAARGLRTGGLEELAAIAAGQAQPETVFITFDDGFHDNFATVLPMLRERGMKAFVFVLPPLVDAAAPLAWPEMTADLRRFGETMRSVDWAMVEEMREGGLEIGSHTLTHPHLPALGEEELRFELAESKARVEARLGTCETLAYPFGEWSPLVERIAGECGYRFAFSLPTSHGQHRAGELTIPRVNVDFRDEGRRFAAKLSPLGRTVYLAAPLKALRRGLGAAKARLRRAQ